MNLYLSKSKHPTQGKIDFQGLPVIVENKAGSVRHWHDPHSNESGETKMAYPYGYVKGTLGLDGDEVDVFVGPNKESNKVFVITQMRRDLDKDGTDEFKHIDEQKIMLGFDSKKEAKHAYNRHYDDYRFFGSIKKLKLDEFKEELKARKGKLIKHLYINEQSANIQAMDKSFKSKAQQKYMFAAAERGEIPKETVKEFADKTKDYSKLPEKKAIKKAKKDMKEVLSAIEKAHIGFDKLKAKISKEGSASDPGAVAAAVGRKKYGEKKMEHASVEGKPLKEDQKIKKACDHGEDCKACGGATDVLKGLSSRMLSIVAKKPSVEQIKLVPRQATADLKHPFESPVIAAERIQTPMDTAPSAPDFMASCDSCGYVHKSLVECPRCEFVKSQDRQALPIWRR